MSGSAAEYKEDPCLLRVVPLGAVDTATPLGIQPIVVPSVALSSRAHHGIIQ